MEESVINLGVRVTVEDLLTGRQQERVIMPGDYTVVAVLPCVLDEIERDGPNVRLTMRGFVPLTRTEGAS